MLSAHIARCLDYDPQHVEDAIRESVAALGGMSAFVKPGQRVLLKPNLLRPASLDSAVCTHPSVVRAVAKLVAEAGGHAVIADSPGGPHSGVYLRMQYRRTGMEAVAKETGAECSLDMRTTEVDCPDAKVAKRIERLAVVAEADVIISLPKLKTHGFMVYTGATKNLFGTIPGLAKMACHSRWRARDDFADMLLDVMASCAPALTILDGVVGMEGNGPSSGQPRETGVILASQDGAALDVVATHIIGADPMEIPPLARAKARGWITGSVRDIETTGVPLHEAKLARPYALPDTTVHRRSSPFQALTRLWPSHAFQAYPAANARCVGCGTCAQACPAQAITITDGHAQFDLDKCIRCYCCHELCPHDAVALRRSAVGRLVAGRA